MKKLENDWLTQGLIDFEYKKYVLLAYFKEIKENFSQVKLYPHLADLVFHYQNLLEFKKNKTLINQNFPKQIESINLFQQKINYAKLVEDEDLLKEFEDIIAYAIPQFKNILNEGKDIYEYIESKIEIEPVGIVPLHITEGYVLLEQEQKQEIGIYEYKAGIFGNSKEKFRGIYFNFLESIAKKVSTTYENIKLEIIKRYQKLPNPATYLIYSGIICPNQETLIPITKRLLVQRVF